MQFDFAPGFALEVEVAEVEDSDGLTSVDFIAVQFELGDVDAVGLYVEAIQDEGGADQLGREDEGLGQ